MCTPVGPWAVGHGDGRETQNSIVDFAAEERDHRLDTMVDLPRMCGACAGERSENGDQAVLGAKASRHHKHSSD